MRWEFRRAHVFDSDLVGLSELYVKSHPGCREMVWGTVRRVLGCARSESVTGQAPGHLGL